MGDQLQALPLPVWRACAARFPGRPDQIRHARALLTGFLNGWPAADDAVLLVSELVTNAIQHSHSARPGGCLTVSAILAADCLRVEVEDDGGPWQPQPPSDGLRGRGLAIVAALAHWGVTGDGDGSRTVWFELPCPIPNSGPTDG